MSTSKLTSLGAVAAEGKVAVAVEVMPCNYSITVRGTTFMPKYLEVNWMWNDDEFHWRLTSWRLTRSFGHQSLAIDGRNLATVPEPARDAVMGTRPKRLR